jgi:hypothetical protein
VVKLAVYAELADAITGIEFAELFPLKNTKYNHHGSNRCTRNRKVELYCSNCSNNIRHSNLRRTNRSQIKPYSLNT